MLPGARNESSVEQRPIDISFIVVFLVFAFTSTFADLYSTPYPHFTPDSPSYWVRANYWYAHDTDPLFMNPPFMMRIITGLSAFVYGPFYPVLAHCLLRGKNAIQLPAVIYATMIVSITAILVFGVEVFGEPEFRTPNPVKFLTFNLPYVLIPLLLLIRMRKPEPFARKF